MCDYIAVHSLHFRSLHSENTHLHTPKSCNDCDWFWVYKEKKRREPSNNYHSYIFFVSSTHSHQMIPFCVHTHTHTHTQKRNTVSWARSTAFFCIKVNRLFVRYHFRRFVLPSESYNFMEKQVWMVQWLFFFLLPKTNPSILCRDRVNTHCTPIENIQIFCSAVTR